MALGVEHGVEVNFARMDTGMRFSQAMAIVSEVKGWLASVEFLEVLSGDAKLFATAREFRICKGWAAMTPSQHLI